MSENNAPAPAATSSPLKSVATAVATAAQAVREGAGDTLAKARQALPATGEYVGQFVYSTFYYLSYGVVFPTLLVTNFVPGCSPIANGLVGGATAANDVILDMKEKAATRKAARAEGPAASANA